MIAEDKAEKLADLLLRVEMSAEEMGSWLKAIPKLNREQLEELISTFENELNELDRLKQNTKEELKPKLAEAIKDKY